MTMRTMRVISGGLIAALLMMTTLYLRAAQHDDTCDLARAAQQRACASAALHVAGIRSWLSAGHPRQHEARLLLDRDVAWAPLCAGRAGEELRARMLAHVVDPDTAVTAALAAELEHLLDAAP